MLGVLVVAGCTTRPPQVLRAEDVPTAFTGTIPPSAEVWPRTDWWQSSANPELTSLIDAAKDSNLDLSVAAARVLAARAELTIERSALLPQLSAGAQVDRVRESDFLASGSAPADFSVNSSRGLLTNPSSHLTSVYGVNLTAAYQVDLWGMTRANARSAKEALRSAQFAQQTVALTVVTNVANNYLAVLALRKRIAIAEHNIAAINDILSVIRLRVSTGVASRLDLAREEAQIESAEAQVAMLQSEERIALMTLGVLLGRAPEGFDVKAESMEVFQPPPMAPGIPAELLARRPDIAVAEANLASAHANVDAARAAFLPQLTLNANGTFASTAAAALFRGPNFAWDIGAGILQTIFDGGGLLGRKRRAEAGQTELIASYRRAIFNAYLDVEAALSSLSSAQTAEEHLTREVDAAREAFQITDLQYRQGVTDLLSVLQAQETLFTAEDQLAQVKLARMQADVKLYGALGGGWIEPPEARTQAIRLNSSPAR